MEQKEEIQKLKDLVQAYELDHLTSNQKIFNEWLIAQIQKFNQPQSQTDNQVMEELKKIQIEIEKLKTGINQIGNLLNKEDEEDDEDDV